MLGGQLGELAGGGAGAEPRVGQGPVEGVEFAVDTVTRLHVGQHELAGLTVESRYRYVCAAAADRLHELVAAQSVLGVPHGAVNVGVGVTGRRDRLHHPRVEFFLGEVAVPRNSGVDQEQHHDEAGHHGQAAADGACPEIGGRFPEVSAEYREGGRGGEVRRGSRRRGVRSS